MREKQEEKEVRYQEQRGLLHPPSIQEVINVQSIEEAYEIQAKIHTLVRIPGGSTSTTEKEGKDKSVVVVGDEQEDLTSSSLLCKRSRKKKERVVLALDIAYSTKSDLAVASGVLWEQQEQKKIERDESKIGKKAARRTGGRQTGRILGERVQSGKVNFPYQPGLLAFREIPLLVDVIQDLLSVFAAEKGKKKQGGAKLEGEDDDDDDEDDNLTLLCDGAGIAHPRFCGIACHLGVLFQVPSIGVAKNHLVGDFDDGKGGEGNGAEEEEEKNPPPNRGSFAQLLFQGKVVGTVLRTQDNVRPIFVSPGHLVSIEGATETVLRLCSQYRLPEPIRRADHVGRMELKRIEQEREEQQK